MKRDKIIYRAAIGTFIISILIISYASYQIIYSRNKVKENLEILDSIKKDKKSSVIKENSSLPENQKETYSNHGLIGKLTIERTKKILPIVEGTSEDKLKRGAGHYEASSSPGERGNCIVFGHRDGVFSSLGEIKVNDYITIETDKGSFSYKVVSIKITEPKNEEILKNYSEPMLTLVTCYPFGYVGASPERFIVVAKLQ